MTSDAGRSDRVQPEPAGGEPVPVEQPDDLLDESGDAGGLGGGLDLGALLEQAQQLQQQLLEAQATASEQVVEGQAGGGVVRVTVDGALRFQRVEISPDVIDRDDPEMLEDLVLAALHDAVDRLEEAQRAAMGGGAGLGPAGPDLGGLDLGGLLGGGGP